MNKKNILSILVIVYLITSVLSVISLLYAINKTTISGKATTQQGTISFILEESAEPAPAPSLGGGPSGGGGTEAITEKEQDLTFSEDTLKIITKVHRPYTKQFIITNPSETSQTGTIEIEGLSEKITPSESRFIIFPKESKTVILHILSDEIGVETGRMIIRTSGKTYAIPIILETESVRVLFDVSLEVKPKTVFPGEKITAQTLVYNINEVGLIDVKIAYTIKDFDNHILLEDEETVTLENQATTSKEFIIPPGTKEGEYILIVQAVHEDSVGTASEAFTVGKIEKPSAFNIYYLLIALILILIVIMALIIHKKNKKKKITERRMKKLVKQHLKGGHTKEEITLELREKGWPEEIIERLLK